MNHWVNFRKDRYYLLKYLSAHLLFIGGINALLWERFNEKSFWAFEFTPYHALLLIPALIIGVQVPVLIHNCVHRNLRNKFANSIAGELAGFYVLLSMAAFELNHLMHHANADTDLDPHNPHNRGFMGFFLANNFGGGHVVQEKFLLFHGDSRLNRMIFALSMFLHFLNVPLRLLAWFLLLGPTLFVSFFVPSYLFHMFVFAHINYVTHETREDGSVRLYNLDSNFYYRFVNYFGSGVYYHKNHHDHPNHYNPKLGASRSWIIR